MNRIQYCLGLCFIATVVLLTSCAPTPGPVNFEDPKLSEVWPKAPERPRIKLLRSLSGADDMRDESVRKNRLFRWLTGEMTEQIPLVSPYGIATDGAGTIWVADPGARALHVFDLGRQKSQLWTLAGQQYFMSPVGVAYDSKNKRILVSDSLLKKIYILSLKGELIDTIDPTEPFGRPGGIALDTNGELLVADVLKGKVRRFSSAGLELSPLGSPTTPDGLFNQPTAVAVDSQGLVYIVDSLNFRIEVISPLGEAIASIGGLGDMPGNLSRPRGVAVDNLGHIYISDAAFDNIQIFNLKGELLLVFGGDGKEKLSLPASLTTDQADRIYVVDSFNHQVKIYQYRE